jgi:hypothetical protein
MTDSTDRSLALSFPNKPKTMANGQLKSLMAESWYIILQLWFPIALLGYSFDTICPLKGRSGAGGGVSGDLCRRIYSQLCMCWLYARSWLRARACRRRTTMTIN